MRFFKLLIPALAVWLCLSGCDYQYGPILSFRKKELRIQNEWLFSRVARNGNNITKGTTAGSIDFVSSTLGFTLNDNLRRFNATYSFILDNGAKQLYEFDGDWVLTEDEDSIILSYDPPYPAFGDKQTLLITKLFENHMWLREFINDGDDPSKYNIIDYELTAK